MGIGGHRLSDRKTATLSERTGLSLNRAFRRNHYCEGVEWRTDGTCRHYEIVWGSWEYVIIAKPIHFTSCPPREGTT